MPSSRLSQFRLKPTELLLLSTFLRPRILNQEMYFPGETWNALLGREPKFVLLFFEEHKLIRILRKEEALANQLSPSVLISMTRSMGLAEDTPVGNVIATFANKASNDEYRVIIQEDLYRCTETGTTISDAFLERKGASRALIKSIDDEGFIGNVRLIGASLLGAAATGIVGNRSDALLVGGLDNLSAKAVALWPAEAPHPESSTSESFNVPSGPSSPMKSTPSQRSQQQNDEKSNSNKNLPDQHPLVGPAHTPLSAPSSQAHTWMDDVVSWLAHFH